MSKIKCLTQTRQEALGCVRRRRNRIKWSVAKVGADGKAFKTIPVVNETFGLTVGMMHWWQRQEIAGCCC
jgi:hypothetical protein